MHSRDGEPEHAIATCILADGRRAWGTSDDPALTRAMCEGEWVGRAVELDPEGTLLA
jgi:acetyl-CoA C-acetyltransferase